MERGRRARAAPDDGRRGELGPGARDRRAHGGERGLLRPAEPGRDVRDLVAAAAPPVDDDRRRAGLGDPQVDRWREHVARDQPRPPLGGQGPHRVRGLAPESRRPVRDRGGERRRRGHLPLGEHGGELVADLALPVGRAHVLPRTVRGPAPLRPHLLARHLRADVGGRRGDVGAAPHAGRTRRPPRAHVRPGRPGAHHPRQRRGAVRDEGLRRELALLRQPAAHAVLQGRDLERRAVLLRVRGDAGQQHARAAHRRRSTTRGSATRTGT